MRMAEVALPWKAAKQEKMSSSVIFISGWRCENWLTDLPGVLLLRRAGSA
jgi:hypothetical protein